MDKNIEFLNAPTAEERLANLKTLLAQETEKPKELPQFANNHIHTIYSFSPYSPTAAVYAARKEGLKTAGIMDHDSIGGAREFREAAKIAGLGSTCGLEVRVSLRGTKFENTRLNNPDQVGVAYMALHSVREEYFDVVQNKLAPLREKRNERNRKMLKNIEKVTGIALDFEKDVLPLSNFADGGSVTERHLLFALAGKMEPNATPEERYKLLGKLKAELVADIYVPADDELMSLSEVVEFAKEIDAYLCYAYLGDVTNSPTGDKKAAKFEDDYLDELMEFLKEQGVNTITYMPSRNTKEQMTRLMGLCDKMGFNQISGEDVNSLGQSFICKQLEDPMFAHLVDVAWNLVEREK